MVGRTAIDSQADRLYVEVLRLALQIRNGLVPNLHLRVRGVARPAVGQRIAPLITGSSIMPFSTPHIVAMVLYSPVCIRCSNARRSDSASPEPLATGHPYGAVSKISPAGASAPPLSLTANPVTGESAAIASTSPAINAAVKSSWRV